MTEENIAASEGTAIAVADRPTKLTPYKQRRAAGAVELTPKHKLLADYMAHGTNHIRAQRLGIPTNVPLSVEQAAAVLDIRRRNAREITALPEFQKLLLKLTAALRSGEYARSIRTIVEVRDDTGAGLAADRKVRLDAAKTLIGDDSDKGLNVNVNLGVRVTPGIVIRVRDPGPEIKTIEGTPNLLGVTR
jgi:hypothetical protein